MPGADPKPERSARTPFGRGPTGLHGGLTVALGLFLLLGLLLLSIAQPVIGSEAMLREPVAMTAHAFERRLELLAASRALPEWEQRLLAPLLPAGETLREEAVQAFGTVITRRGFAREGAPVDEAGLDGLRARRALLLDEMGRIEEARGDLDALAARGHGAFVELMTDARAVGAAPRDESALDVAGDGWIGRSARARRTGAPRPQPGAAAERALRVARIRAGLVAVGLAIVLAWVARNRPDGPIGRLSVPAPWPATAGLGVLVRAGFLACVVAFGLEALSSSLGTPLPAALVATISALPLAWLAQRHLLEPFGARWRDLLGLGTGRSAAIWIPTVLGLFALEQIGARALATAADALGAPTPWTAGLGETRITSTPAILVLTTIDTVVCAAIATEIAFRGVLYPTLRATHGRLHAAVLTGLLFSALQLTGLPGLLALSWTGVIYALAVEHTRSLVPVIAASMLASALAVAESVALYR